MGIAALDLCWKFLYSISESDTPSDFVNFYQTLKQIVAHNELRFSTADRPISVQDIRRQMVEAIGRSLVPRSAVLPAVGHSISIQGETWHVILSATSMPHFKVAVVETTRGGKIDVAYRFQIVRGLIDSGVIDLGKIEDGSLYGKTWELYLFCKIQKLRELRESFWKLPYRSQPVLITPSEVFPHLTTALPGTSTVRYDASSIRAFLDQCDRLFVERVGREEIASYLKRCGISMRRFLSAQRKRVLGISF